MRRNCAVSRLTPWVGGALLAACAIVVPESQRSVVLVTVMLFCPLFDRQWRLPAMPSERWHKWSWLAVLTLTVALLAWRPAALQLFIASLLLAALPEEWFFRAYFMVRLGTGWRANLFVSVVFAALHGLTHDWMTAALVFLPSLAYGWLYQRTRDLTLVVLMHALSNLIYMLGFGVWLHVWLALPRS